MLSVTSVLKKHPLIPARPLSLLYFQFSSSTNVDFRISNFALLPSALQFRPMSAPVKVQIFGQVYSIRGELEEKYVQKLAKYVDEKMQAIAEATGIVDTQKLAVLAALAIADELHSLKTEVTDEEEMLREQAERCLTLVERALKQTA